jgi:hypothetical protein
MAHQNVCSVVTQIMLLHKTVTLNSSLGFIHTSKVTLHSEKYEAILTRTAGARHT